jgi:hypothetical protein
LEDADDSVSNDPVPSSTEVETSGGSGGTAFAGASSPFFVVDPDREPRENSPLTLGAEATLRMNLEAVAPIALGLSGALVLEREAGFGRLNEDWRQLAVWDLLRGVALVLRDSVGCFSVLRWLFGVGTKLGLNEEGGLWWCGEGQNEAAGEVLM